MQIDVSGIEFDKSSEKLIFLALCSWKYQKIKANYYNISKETLLGESTVTKALRKLLDRGMVHKTNDGSYYIKKELLNKIKIEEEDVSSMP